MNRQGDYYDGMIPRRVIWAVLVIYRLYKMRTQEYAVIRRKDNSVRFTGYHIK